MKIFLFCKSTLILVQGVQKKKLTITFWVGIGIKINAMNFKIFVNKKSNIHSPQVACAISCGKTAFRKFLSIVLISSNPLLRVCSCTSHYVYASFRSQNQIWLSCLVTFITQVWLKIIELKFCPSLKQIIPTPPENIIKIHLIMSFHRLVSYS